MTIPVIPFPPSVLQDIYWHESWLEFTASSDLDLPAFTGSTIRGALGAVMRPGLCAKSGGNNNNNNNLCGESCELPDQCPFFSLFEQSRATTAIQPQPPPAPPSPARDHNSGGTNPNAGRSKGSGSNQPKPFLLIPPLTHAMEEIARGATISEPFTLLPPQQQQPPQHGRHRQTSTATAAFEQLPVLVNDWRIGVPAGATVSLGIRALGPVGAALPGVIEGLRLHGLEVKGGLLRLPRHGESPAVRRRNLPLHGGGGGNHLARVPTTVSLDDARRLRVTLLTPLMIRDGAPAGGGNTRGASSPSPAARVAELVLQQAVVRAVKLYNAFAGKPPLPFVSPSFPGLTLTASRLFHYQFQRKSYRQDRWMEFDGVIGWLEWEGPGVRDAVPWLQAAEFLHLGQKASFGLGRVAVEWSR